MSLIVTYDELGSGGGDDLTAAYGLPPSAISIPTRAEDGDSGSGVLPFEDPAAALTLAGHKPITVEEDECAQPRLFTGYVVERGFARSGEDGLIVGNDRLVEVNVYDQNAAAHFIIISGTDGNRPQETWAARVAWLMASDYLAPFIGGDTTYIGPWTQTMDAADYRGGYAASVLDDLCERTGDAATWYLFWNPDTSSVELFCTGETTTIGTCTLKISNVESDIDGVTVFAPDMLAKLAREPDQVYSEVIVEYGDGQKVYRSLDETATTYTKRGTTISRPYTRRESTAIAQADQWLAKHSYERDRITCVMRSVPAASVGLVRAGMGIDFKASHLPGYSADYVEMRIVMCSPVPVSDIGDLYDISLELVGSAAAVSPPEPENVTIRLMKGTLLEYDGFHPDDPCERFGGGPGPLMWDAVGDSPPLGYGTYNTVGPVEAVSSDETRCAPQTKQIAVRTLGYGTVDIELTHGSLYVGTKTHVWTIRVNDVPVATFTDTDAAGSSSCYLTASDVTVAYGDLVTGHVYVDSEPAFWAVDDLAAGYQTHLTVTGSLTPDPPPTGDPIPSPIQPSTTTHTTDPTVDDDESIGYGVGDVWINTTSGDVFVATDVTDGAAVWAQSAPMVAAAPTTADYLVGTAQAGLSAEIVVGTTPGGELGGTWASPTVDATHAGSTHIALADSVTDETTWGIAPADGSAGTASRSDHTHGSPAAPPGEMLVADGTSGPEGITPTSYVEMSTPDTTTSGTLEDITGCSTTITVERTSHVAAWLNTQISGSGVCVIGVAVNFDGTDHDEVQHAISGSDAATLSVVHRTATELAPGTYTIKGRMRRVSGASTPQVDRADLLVMAMGHSGPVLLTNEAEDDYLYADL